MSSLMHTDETCDFLGVGKAMVIAARYHTESRDMPYYHRIEHAETENVNGCRLVGARNDDGGMVGSAFWQGSLERLDCPKVGITGLFQPEVLRQ